MTISYLFSKFIKKLPGSAIKNSSFEKPSKCEARSTVVNSSLGRYSYCGYSCTIIDSSIGRFTSIGDNVSIGVSGHPISWVSTSPAFYFGKDSIPKNLAKLEYNPSCGKTKIGNDVWVGKNAIIMGGLTIGDGAIIGAGAVVTHDVEPYTIVGGVPAKVIKKRLDDEKIEKLLNLKWWDYSLEKLSKYAEYMNDPDVFLTEIESR